MSAVAVERLRMRRTLPIDAVLPRVAWITLGSRRLFRWHHLEGESP